MAFDDPLGEEQMHVLHVEIEEYLRQQAEASAAGRAAVRLTPFSYALAIAAACALVASQLAPATLPWLTAAIAAAAVVVGAATLGAGLVALVARPRRAPAALPRPAMPAGSSLALPHRVPAAALVLVLLVAGAGAGGLGYAERHGRAPRAIPAQAPTKSMVNGCYAKPAAGRPDCGL